MFHRSLPRAAARVTRFAQCENLPQPHTLTKLPSRTWRPIQQPCGRRCKSTFRDQFTEQVRRAPVLFPFAVGCILVVSGIAVFYIPWYYQNVIIRPYHNFPEPVAKKLRRALFYSTAPHEDLREANKYFRQALQVATELGMDPFSDEIMGVKYKIAQLFERAGYYQMSCDVLEIMRVDCQRWMDEFSDRHWTDGHRARVLKNTVQIHVKLGTLYDSKYMNEPEDAEKRLVYAVETVLREKNRRESDGVKEGEGDWMSDEEMGGTFEALGHHYEQQNSHYLATPLFLQALALCPPTSCHAVLLMNNISTCLAQQTPPPPSSSPAFSNTPPPSRATLVDNARQWASKALALASAIKPPERTEECDLGCATATHNLGEFFEMEGRVAEARQRYKEAEALSKTAGFTEGLLNARAGLTRVKVLENGQ
ncbi:hypothetical protein K504DRAFT_470976 [Pleomassaria siparia CBS 279.74]|uniref:TPR domain-containing protein n=1 Tax=Pleomassaria siparia CBS 279.74 TaxID=1314801 RepID=A0A6G1K058_9PLEO|nr:hypothetical protein K504DRAFT_470976 [Pleomassaria siparia CBS 279.74]